MSGSPIRATMFTYALDCPDAAALAEFYARLLGWEVQASSDDPEWVDVVPPEGDTATLKLACQQIEHYRVPDWPDGPIPQQAHIDFYVESVADDSARAEAAGATRHAYQPSESGSFVVFTDPVGHPFCLCQA